MTTPDAQLFWFVPVIRKALKIIKQHGIDAFIITSPPWSAQIAGYCIKRLAGIPWVADLRDPWTDIPRYDRMGVTRQLDVFLERKCLGYADRVISTSDTYSEQLRQRFPQAQRGKFVTLYNGFDEEKLDALTPRLSDSFTIVHLGTFYPQFDSFFIFEALGQWLAKDSDVVKSRVRLVFVGKVQDDLRDVLAANGLLEITEITGFKPHREAIDIAAGADALLLSIGLNPATPRGWLPSKIFEYIALNRPVVASVVEGEAANLIRRARSGFVIAGKDRQQVFDIFHSLYRKKTAGSESRYAWKNDEAVIDELKQAHLIGRLSEMLNVITSKNTP